MFVHTLFPKLQTKNDNRFEYVKNVILTERIQPGSNNQGEQAMVLCKKPETLNLMFEFLLSRLLFSWAPVDVTMHTMHIRLTEIKHNCILLKNIIIVCVCLIHCKISTKYYIL